MVVVHNNSRHFSSPTSVGTWRSRILENREYYPTYFSFRCSRILENNRHIYLKFLENTQILESEKFSRFSILEFSKLKISREFGNPRPPPAITFIVTALSMMSCFSGYSCALVSDILLQGHLYITENYFAFHSNVFGYVTRVSTFIHLLQCTHIDDSLLLQMYLHYYLY